MKQYPPLITAPLDKPVTEDKLLPCGNWKLEANGDGTGTLKPVRSLNADFEGVMPGADQLIHDGVNAKAIEESCLTSQCLTDKGRALLEGKPANQSAALRRNITERLEEWAEETIFPADLVPKHHFKLTDRNGDMGVIPSDMTYNPKFSITDQHGGRGVVVKVIPDDQIPKENDGNVADIVIIDYSSSPFRRPDFGNWLNNLPRKK